MIIGLGHVARVGKDTVAEFLEKEHGYTRLAFADELRRLAVKVNPIVGPNYRLGNAIADHGWEGAKTQFPEVRIFLQHLGTACRDVFNEKIWVNRVADQIYENPRRDYVITDVRFRNECDVLKRFDNEIPVKLVKVFRPGYVASGHVSETALINYAWDYVLDNTGTIDDLGHAVVRMLDAFAPVASE